MLSLFSFLLFKMQIKFWKKGLMLFLYFKINNNNNFKMVWDMWYGRLLLYSATKESQLWFWVEHLTPWGWRLLYQPAGGQVLEPTPPISWVLPSGGWTRSGYVLHIFCSWDGNQDSPNMFCGSPAKLTKRTCGKEGLVGKQPANAPWRHKRVVCSNPLIQSSEGDVTFGKCLWHSKKKKKKTNGVSKML